MGLIIRKIGMKWIKPFVPTFTIILPGRQIN